MAQHMHCPNCRHVGKPSRALGAGSLLYLLSPLVLAAVALLFGLHARLAGLLTLAWLPFAVWGMMLVRCDVCAACGWRHVRPASAEEQARIPAA